MTVQPPRNPARPDDDWYITPGHAVDSLLAAEKFHGLVWEPCCGDGSISKVLLNAGLEVASSNLNDHGYGHHGYDFLSDACDWTAENIVTNPPYNLAEAFIRTAVRRATSKVAFLLRLAFLEGQKRKKMYDEIPPARIHIFSKRLTMYPGGVDPKGNGSIAFAWFVWDRAHVGAPTFGWV